MIHASRLRTGSAKALLGVWLFVQGCAAPHTPGLAYVSAVDNRDASWLPAGRGQLSLAQEFAGRVEWPALDDGYEVEAFGELFEFRVDDQSFYDTLGGGFFQSSEALRQRITIR